MVKEASKEEEKITTEEGKLKTIIIGDKEHKVIDTVTVMEIIVHKLEGGQEVSQFVAHEFMMTDNKVYMVKLLTDAINTTVKAVKRKSLIQPISKALMNKFFNRRPRFKDRFLKR